MGIPKAYPENPCTLVLGSVKKYGGETKMDDKQIHESRSNNLLVISIISIVINMVTLWYVHDKLEQLLRLLKP